MRRIFSLKWLIFALMVFACLEAVRFQAFAQDQPDFLLRDQDTLRVVDSLMEVQRTAQSAVTFSSLFESTRSPVCWAAHLSFAPFYSLPGFENISPEIGRILEKAMKSAMGRIGELEPSLREAIASRKDVLPAQVAETLISKWQAITEDLNEEIGRTEARIEFERVIYSDFLKVFQEDKTLEFDKEKFASQIEKRVQALNNDVVSDFQDIIRPMVENPQAYGLQREFETLRSVVGENYEAVLQRMLVGYGGHGLSFYTHRSVRLMKIPKDSYIDYLAFDSEYLMAVADMDPNELSRTGGIYFSALTLDGDRVFRSLFKGTRYRLALDEGDQSYSFSRGDISVELIQALGEVHRSIENNFGDAIRRLKETDRFEKIRDLESVRIAILFDEGGALDSAALLDRARSRLEYVESKVRILEEFKNEIESFARQVELCRQIPSHIDPAVSNKTAAELANTPEKLSNAIKRYKKSNWRTLLGHDHELSNGLKVRFTLQEVAR